MGASKNCNYENADQGSAMTKKAPDQKGPGLFENIKLKG